MFDINKFNQLSEKLKYKDTQSKLYMSNKYFRIINQLVRSKQLKKNHVPYVYSYMYLMTYLFRYTKYEDVVLSAKEIKSILQYSPTNKKVDYITKVNGLLDTVGLTSTLYDFPIIHEVVDRELQFKMLSDLNDNNRYGTKWREINNINFNVSSKYPTLSFHKDIEQYKQECILFNNMGGTFFNTEDSTMVPFEVFLYCMSHEELGTFGFYLYSYIAYMNELYGGLKMSINELAINNNMSETTLQQYLNVLRKYNLVNTVMADYFVVGKNKKVKGEANTHFANEYKDFIMDNSKVKELEKPNFIHVGEYLKRI